MADLIVFHGELLHLLRLFDLDLLRVHLFKSGRALYLPHHISSGRQVFKVLRFVLFGHPLPDQFTVRLSHKLERCAAEEFPRTSIGLFDLHLNRLIYDLKFLKRGIRQDFDHQILHPDIAGYGFFLPDRIGSGCDSGQNHRFFPGYPLLYDGFLRGSR